MSNNQNERTVPRLFGFRRWGLFLDIKGDGKPDLVVGNDAEPNYLYINRGDGTLEDQSYDSGFVPNRDGREIASMGIAAGDYENNGGIDPFVTDFSDDYKVLFRQDPVPRAGATPSVQPST